MKRWSITLMLIGISVIIAIIIGLVILFFSANNNSENCLTDDIPDGLELLNSQAGGQTLQLFDKDNEFDAYTLNSVRGKLMNVQDGTMLKALPGIKGLRERSFYESLNKSSGSNYTDLRNFVAEYRGLEIFTICGFSTTFLKLKDITCNMSEPCVMDVKIGQRTWDPFATPEKIQREKALHGETRSILGLGIQGIRVFDIKSGRLTLLRHDLRHLKADNIKDAFKLFLNADAQLSKVLILPILSQLKPIQAWARTQTSWRIYSSSVMLAYDAKELEKRILCGNRRKTSNSDGQKFKQKEMVNDCDSLETNQWVFVKMIDFEHIFPAENASIDENYLFGIDNLVKLFEELLTECIE